MPLNSCVDDNAELQHVMFAISSPGKREPGDDMSMLVTGCRVEGALANTEDIILQTSSPL